MQGPLPARLPPGGKLVGAFAILYGTILLGLPIGNAAYAPLHPGHGGSAALRGSLLISGLPLRNF